MLRTRIAVIGAGVGLTALVWFVWAAIPHRSANSLPSEVKAPSPNEPKERSDGRSAEDEHAARPVVSEPPPTVARPEITFQIRQYPKDQQPWNHGDAIRVRLDIDRLRAHDLSSDDVMKSFHGCSIVGSPMRVEAPPGVVFVTRLDRPELYEEYILKCNAEGEIVRLKDVAKVELLADEEAQEAEPNAAVERPRD